MCWNDGYERKRFEEKLKKQREEYKKHGMTDTQIEEIGKTDWEIYRSDRRFFSHTQPLESDDSFDDDGRNPLMAFFSEELSVASFRDCSNRYWWMDEIENPDLYETLIKFPECDKTIISLLVFEGFTQTQIAHDIYHVSDNVIYKKVKRIRLKLTPFFAKKGGMQ